MALFCAAIRRDSVSLYISLSLSYPGLLVSNISSLLLEISVQLLFVFPFQSPRVVVFAIYIYIANALIG